MYGNHPHNSDRCQFWRPNMEKREDESMMIPTRYLGVFFVLLMLSAPVLFAGTLPAPPSESKWAALIDQAGGGDPEAQYALAIVYEKGKGDIPRDLAKARKWYERAAAQGHSNAQNKMAVMHYKGLGGLVADAKKAVTYMERSAEQNNDAALMMLGQIYYNGADGIPMDRKKAAEYFGRSARLGHRMAQDYLGVMYYNGEGGLKQNKEKARWWYAQSAERGYELAKIHLASMLYHGEGGLEPDQEKAISDLEELAKNGNVAAFQLLEKWSGGETTERKVTLPLKKGTGKARYPWDPKYGSEEKTP